MKAEVIAILSSVFWAADAVLVRLGARSSNVVAAAFLSYSVAAVSFWGCVLLYQPADIVYSPATIYFVLSGCLQPLLARILFYMGITRMGVSRAAPLRGVEPLLTVMLALIFLHEQPNAYVYLGTILVVAGIGFITSSESGAKRYKPSHLLLPIGAAFFGAVSQNLRRGGLLILRDPIFGAAVSSSTSWILFAVFLLMTGRARLLRMDKESFPFFAVAAAASLLAQFLNFSALNLGEVSAMAALVNTTPLFSVLFGFLFLRDLEKVTARVACGATLMVAGAVVIAVRHVAS